MQARPFRYYLLNCFLLSIPVMIWNIALANELPNVFQPDIFWAGISPVIKYGENISRALLFILMAFMPLSLATVAQKRGLIIYLSGLVLYFLSWVLLIWFPGIGWSNSAWGFMAPAYTPLLWLFGIWIIGRSYYFNLSINRYVFLFIAILFLLFHNIHTYTIYVRMH